MTFGFAVFAYPQEMTVAGARSADPSGLALSEGFEEGTMPPANWALEVTNADFTWEITSDSPFEGAFAAEVPADPEPFSAQSEMLITPELLLDTGTLTFWSRSNLFWCRDGVDNCDLWVWLVVGEVGGADDTLLGLADDDWTATDVWSQSSFDLTSHLPGAGVPVRVAFEYFGFDDRAAIALDSVAIEGGETSLIFTDGFETGDTSAWSATVE